MKSVATFIQPGLSSVQSGTHTESILRRCSSYRPNRRCEVISRRSGFVTPSALPVTEGQLIQTQQTVDRFRACAEAPGADHQNTHSEKQPEYTPVEDGVILPKVKGGEEELRAQSGWLEIELRNWLDNEWPDNNAARSHNRLAHRAAQLYERLRAEGIHDVGTLMLGIGTALEGEDFSKAYVGAWNIANKLSDLIIQGFAPGRTVDDLRNGGGGGEQPVSPEATWSVLDDPHEGKDTGSRRRAASPSLADGFERYRFLQMVLDGSASKALIDGAVAVAMGFNYNMADGTWTNEDVTDGHFKQFGNLPPDVLGDEFGASWTDTLKYLDEQVKADDEDGAKEEGLNVVIETLHGMEATKLQSADEYDHSFHKRVAVAKWLHLLGGF